MVGIVIDTVGKAAWPVRTPRPSNGLHLAQASAPRIGCSQRACSEAGAFPNTRLALRQGSFLWHSLEPRRKPAVGYLLECTASEAATDTAHRPAPAGA
jgi:hypothetical protein